MAPAALWLYRCLMYAALPGALPWLALTQRRRGAGRAQVRRRLGMNLPDVPKNGVWVQAVSVGEVAVARPLLRELRGRFPQLPMLLTSTTSTGLELAARSRAADTVLPFPLDLPGPVRRVLDAVAPRLLVLVETELWPELLAASAERGVPVAIVNARISDRAFRRYTGIVRLLRPLLRPVTLALAQGGQEAERLAALGIPEDRVRVAGNIKFDAAPPAASPALLERVRALAGDRPVVVAGSTMSGEDAPVVEAVGRIAAAQRPFLVLAPRHPDRAGEAEAAVLTAGLKGVRRTALESFDGEAEVLVLDTIGELAPLFGVASVAFMGGSLVPTGGHNPLEPARFGVPVLSGPHVRNFEAIYLALVAAGAARLVADGETLAEALAAWLRDPEASARAGRAARELVAANAGATARTVDALEPFLR